MKRVVSLVLIATVLSATSPAVAAKKKKPTAKPAASKTAEKPAPVKAAEKPAEKTVNETVEAAAPQPAPAPAAKTPSETAAAPAAPAPAKSENAPSQVKDDLDFDLLGSETKPLSEAEKLKSEEIDRQGKLRRKILAAHQAIGFALMAAMTLNTVLGTLNYYDKFGGGGFTNNFEIAHLISSVASTALFATNGIMALATPDPYPKPGTWDTARFHRILVTSATVGMVAQIVLGFVSAARLGNLDQRDLSRAHLAIGYVTYALTMGAGLVYLF
jgi:hypothetical protein